MSGKYLAVCLKIAIFPSERCGPALPGALGEVFGLTLAQFWKFLEICPVLYLASSNFPRKSVRFVSSLTPSFQRFLSGSVSTMLEEFQGSSITCQDPLL